MIEGFLCIPLIPWLTIFSFIHRGPYNYRYLKYKNGKELRIRYHSFYSYLLKGIFHFFLGRVELIGPEGDGSEIDKPAVITRFLMQDLTLFPGRNITDANKTYLRDRNFISDWKCLIKFLYLGLIVRTYEIEKDKYSLLNVEFSNFTYADTLDAIKSFAKSKNKNVVNFVNAHCLNVAFENSNYTKVLSKSDLVLPDGMGVQMGCRLQGYHLKDNVNGTDLFPLLLKLIIEENLSVYLLGGTQEVNLGLRETLRRDYPALRIAGGHHGHFNLQKRNDSILEEINKSGAEILLVAFGVPAQEFWIYDNLPLLNSNVVMGVGGLFDFYSGKNKRAPQWVRELGLEWIYRIYQEPKRMWRRYVVGNPKFLYRVIKGLK